MNDINLFFEKFFNKNIQLSEKFIKSLLFEIINKNKKVLIFGMGYDSLLWYKANNCKNIFFIEDNDNYIKLNHKIKKKCVVKYNYRNVSVRESLQNKINPSIYNLPKRIEKNKPFDLILIDGPQGYSEKSYGREIPYYWSRHKLMHKKTKIYLDDINRPLEFHLLKKYFLDFQMKYFAEREGSACVFL